MPLLVVFQVVHLMSRQLSGVGINHDFLIDLNLAGKDVLMTLLCKDESSQRGNITLESSKFINLYQFY